MSEGFKCPICGKAAELFDAEAYDFSPVVRLKYRFTCEHPTPPPTTRTSGDEET